MAFKMTLESVIRIAQVAYAYDRNGGLTCDIVGADYSLPSES